MVRALYRRLWLPIYRRYALQKMQETDRFTLAGITVTIPAGVFHPGLFFSTPIFIEFLKRHEFQGQKTVDIGCGSGLLALYAARRGATVIALDINPLSVATTRQNADANQLTLSVLESDLFCTSALRYYLRYSAHQPAILSQTADRYGGSCLLCWTTIGILSGVVFSTTRTHPFSH